MSRVEHGDSREVIRTLADCSVDSCVTDGPYAIQFMGKKWDTGETYFDPEFWVEVLRVLKPGAHVVAFAGTRTYHRLACAIEDAGFEIRDQIGWAFGSGFPKSHNAAVGITKASDPDWKTGQPLALEAMAWEGWGTALKPSWEPICLARKPLIGTVAANVLEHGTGAINIDGCRVGMMTDAEVKRSGMSTGTPGYNGGHRPVSWAEGRNPQGRWPANLIHDGSDEVVDAFPDAPGQQRATGPEFDRNANVYGKFAGVTPAEPRGDSGSAARFFYSAKADADDRLGSKHPTVKPIDLMRYLCRLVTPKGGLVLDPFAGTGTTGVACIAEGFDFILIEREAEYIADIHKRIAWAKGEGELTDQLKARRIPEETKSGADTPLFSGAA